MKFANYLIQFFHEKSLELRGRNYQVFFSSADLSVQLSFCRHLSSVVRPSSITFLTSSQNPSAGFTSNLVGMYLGWISTKFVH